MDHAHTPMPSVPVPEDIEGITQASRDYIEGWYSADPVRMQRCLHKDLVKRTILRDPQSGTWQLRRPSDAKMMVDFTREGGSSHTPPVDQTYDITILDVFRHIACVRVVSHEMMDYLQIAKIDQTWLIVNVLWELKEGEVTPSD